ncbi:hypothetical protein AB4200_21235, partial [Vibrio kanaloae]|uniref:hypothetical protein n=1 Tax=Vibrio kanaloae TaxID=170673 RepID=UPI00354CC70C
VFIIQLGKLAIKNSPQTLLSDLSFGFRYFHAALQPKKQLIKNVGFLNKPVMRTKLATSVYLTTPTPVQLENIKES